METPREQELGASEERYSRRRVIGIATLAFVFCASAAFTVIYLSEVSADAEAAQAAASAATVPDAFASVRLQAQAAYVLDLTTETALYSFNADAQLPLASLTKVALALAVSDVLSPDAIITIQQTTGFSNTAQSLQAGEAWRARDLTAFMLIGSSNYVADILATASNDDIRLKYREAPVEHATLWRMNDLARDLGLTHTYFLNYTGLDLSTTQAGAYGSARDVARLFSYAATNASGVFTGTTQDSFSITSLSGRKATATNTDKALSAIPGLVLGKTGLTDLAGGNLAVVFDVGPAHPVVAVVLHSTEDSRFDDVKKLVTATISSITGEP